MSPYVAMPRETGAQMRWLTMSLLVAGGLLAGCSAVTTGQPVPADHDGPIPVPDSALRKALLDGDALDTIMDASGMKEQTSTDKPFSDDTEFDSSCLAPWQPIPDSVYDDSGYSAINAKTFREDDSSGSKRHVVWQAVVSFKSRAEATDLFGQMSDDWTSCQDRQFTTRSSSGNTDWEFSAVETDESTLTLTQTQLNTPGWSCQHAVRASNNVIIDVLACKVHSADEAKTIVEDIDAKLPSV